MRRTSIATVGTALVLGLLSGCSGSSGSSATVPSSTPSSTTTTRGAPSTTAAGAVDPNAPEVVAPGDIPDNQVFVTYTDAAGGFSVDVPEGWARSTAGGFVSFTDHYNSIQISSGPATAAPTIASVRATGLQDVLSDPTYAAGAVTEVQRNGGAGILATYTIGSAPNDVTGKKALLAVERYVFFHNGTSVVLTLAGAQGADNVDPWRTVTDSLTWL